MIYNELIHFPPSCRTPCAPWLSVCRAVAVGRSSVPLPMAKIICAGGVLQVRDRLFSSRMIIFCCHTPICRVGAVWRHDNVMRPTVSAPPRGFSLLFLSGSRKKKLTKRKAADYASVATPAMLPAIRHANLPPRGGGFGQVPHFTPSAPPPLHAPVRTASASRPGC